MDYDNIVGSENLTCFACPVLYEGVTRSGTPFYFRLRHGAARLVLNEGKHSEQTASMKAINGLDGVCSFAEYKHMFVKLYNELTR